MCSVAWSCQHNLLAVRGSWHSVLPHSYFSSSSLFFFIPSADTLQFYFCVPYKTSFLSFILHYLHFVLLYLFNCPCIISIFVTISLYLTPPLSLSLSTSHSLFLLLFLLISLVSLWFWFFSFSISFPTSFPPPPFVLNLFNLFNRSLFHHSGTITLGALPAPPAMTVSPASSTSVRQEISIKRQLVRMSGNCKLSILSQNLCKLFYTSFLLRLHAFLLIHLFLYSNSSVQSSIIVTLHLHLSQCWTKDLSISLTPSLSHHFFPSVHFMLFSPLILLQMFFI